MTVGRLEKAMSHTPRVAVMEAGESGAVLEPLPQRERAGAGPRKAEEAGAQKMGDPAGEKDARRGSSGREPE